MKFNTIILTFFILFLGVTTSSFAQDNEKISNMLAKKRNYNKKYGFGYRIQLYNGSERRAKSLRGRFQVEFPGVYTKLSYDSPEWKIQVGSYKSRLDADKALLKISEKFSGAIVVPVNR